MELHRIIGAETKEDPGVHLFTWRGNPSDGIAKAQHEATERGLNFQVFRTHPAGETQ